jgi:hypothetical protein
MREHLETAPAISKPVQGRDMQSGLKRLQRVGLLDWSIEAAVIKFPNEFTASDRVNAEFRLKLVREPPADAK